VELDLPFVYFRTEVSVEAKTLRYISVYEIRRLEAPASDFDRLRQFYEQAEAASRAVVILKRVQ
jgi:mRNA degradation ribonuclease J1/J2